MFIISDMRIRRSPCSPLCPPSSCLQNCHAAVHLKNHGVQIFQPKFLWRVVPFLAEIERDVVLSILYGL